MNLTGAIGCVLLGYYLEPAHAGDPEVYVPMEHRLCTVAEVQNGTSNVRLECRRAPGQEEGPQLTRPAGELRETWRWQGAAYLCP